MRNFYIVALPSAIFCYDVQRALIAQLDRVQVSEACGVGSSPAERTKSIFYHASKQPQTIINTVYCCLVCFTLYHYVTLYTAFLAVLLVVHRGDT